MNKNYKRNERGRSMVEMLGVLAIIGVLSVGGISAYSTAMEKHKANEIIYAVSQMAMVASSEQSQKNSPLSLFKDIKGHPFTYKILPDKTDVFQIEIQNIDKGVCKKLLSSGWKLPFEIAINDVERGDCLDINTVAFLFYSNLEQKSPMQCSSNSDCGYSGCYKCEQGICVLKCSENERCAISTTGTQPTPYSLCCSKDKILNGRCYNEIITDENDIKKGCVDSENQACCPLGYFWGVENNVGKCYSCNDTKAISYLNNQGYKTAACFVCPERFLSANHCVMDCAESDQIKINQTCVCPESRPYKNRYDLKCYTFDEIPFASARKIQRVAG